MVSNTSVVWTSVLSTISLILTLLVALFMMGTRWAKLGANVTSIEKRLERIEKLFKLSLKDSDD